MKWEVQKPKRGSGLGVEAGSERGVRQVYDLFPGHSLPVGGVPVRRPLIGFTGVPVTLPRYMRPSCPRGRLGATRARCAPASAPQARMASRRRKPLAYRIICARSARVYAEYHALYAKAPHCCRRYKRSFTKTVRTKSLKKLHKL